MLYDVLVVGAGPAGITAAIYAKRANLKVGLIEKYIPGGQIVNTAEVENYPGVGKVQGHELATNLMNHAESLEVELIFADVLKVDKNGSIKQVITHDKIYETKMVIIATGTVPRKLGVENEDMLSSNGISWCAICDGPLYKDRKVVVIGGGNSAVEESYYLSTLATHVTIVQNLNEFTADPKAVDQLKKASNVDYRLGSTVNKFVINDKFQLHGVEITNKDGETEVLEADGVFEYIGFIPSTNMVKDLGITNEQGFIIVNEKMETSVPGVFAAGDVIVKQIRQIVTATADGAIAVQNGLKYLETWE